MPFEVGEAVRIARYLAEGDRSYEYETRRERARVMPGVVGLIGTVIDRRRGHGACYEIRIPATVEGGETLKCWVDEEELEAASGSPEKVAVRVIAKYQRDEERAYALLLGEVRSRVERLAAMFVRAGFESWVATTDRGHRLTRVELALRVGEHVAWVGFSVADTPKWCIYMQIDLPKQGKPEKSEVDIIPSVPHPGQAIDECLSRFLSRIEALPVKVVAT